jgi:hypothetical protein
MKTGAGDLNCITTVYNLTQSGKLKASDVGPTQLSVIFVFPSCWFMTEIKGVPLQFVTLPTFASKRTKLRIFI